MTVSKLRYQYRIYPTAGKRQMLARTFGCCRTVWNDALQIFQEAHKAGKERPKFGAVTTTVTTTAKRIPERAWLAEVSSVPLQQTMRQLHTAFGNFFDSLSGKRQGPKIGPPRFKRRPSRQAAEFTKQGFRLRSNGKLYLAKIGESVHDQALGMFLRVLTAKAARAGRTAIAIDRFFPSTQICSSCGSRTGPRGREGPHVREWTCNACGAVHDRDVNAAVNILREGLRLSAEQLAAGHR